MRGLGRGLLRLGVLLGLAWGGWTLGQRLLQPLLPPPQEIFVLGGDLQREEVAAQLASYSHLPVLVSGGSNPEYARWLFGRHGLDPIRVTLDYRARDTLGNFTSVVDGLRARGVRHLLLVTSSDHMDRALLVGRLVAGSRGIHLTAVAVPCGNQCHPERRSKVWGDGLRALVWVLSGRDLRSELQAAPTRY